MLPAAEMNPQNAELLAAEHSAIAYAARIYDFNLSEGSWAVAQAECPEAPRHLIVQFRDAEPSGANSMFTAVVPRAGGPVRIIPILHHGMPNRWTFGKDTQQREFMNQVILPDHIDGASTPHADWAGLANCYAALVGDRLISERSGSVIADLDWHGGLSEMNFSTIAADNTRRDWLIRFNRHREIAAFDLAAPQETVQPIPEGPPLKEQPVPSGHVPAPTPVPETGIEP